MSETLLTVEQTAKRLHVHPITVRRHLRNGSLRGIKRGNFWRVPESALYETTTAATAVSPLAHVLALIEDRDARGGVATPRELGVDDVVTELRHLREDQTP